MNFCATPIWRIFWIRWLHRIFRVAKSILSFLQDISYLKIHFDFQGHYFSALFTVFENVENIILQSDEKRDLKTKVNQGH